MKIEKTCEIEIVLTEDEKAILKQAYNLIDKIYWEMNDIRVTDVEVIRGSCFPSVSLNEGELGEIVDNLQILSNSVTIHN